MSNMWQVFYPVLNSSNSSQNPYWGETLQMSRMWQVFYHCLRSPPTLQNPY
ncbi:hypothetical protein LEMLEM_LOCUS21198 [Lemmus lemmus]